MQYLYCLIQCKNSIKCSDVRHLILTPKQRTFKKLEAVFYIFAAECLILVLKMKTINVEQI